MKDDVEKDLDKTIGKTIESTGYINTESEYVINFTDGSSLSFCGWYEEHLVKTEFKKPQ